MVCLLLVDKVALDKYAGQYPAYDVFCLFCCTGPESCLPFIG